MMNKENIFKYGFFILIALIIAILSFRSEPESDKLYVNELESKVKSLNVINSRLKAETRKIIAELAIKMDSISNLKQEVEVIDIKKKQLKHYYERKIKNMDRLNVSELDSLFASRYQSPR